MMKRILAFSVAAAFSLAAFAEGKVTLTDKKGKQSAFDTVSEALAAVKGGGSFRISVPRGTYAEALYYSGSADITISGETDSEFGADVVIALDNSGNILRHKKGDKAIKNRCLFEFEGTGSLTLENLTLHNTYERTAGAKDTQAEALGFDSTGRLAAYNCSFKSHQDTLRTSGKAWFYKCYIEGDVDFLWMERDGQVALYEECEIRSVFDENASNHRAYVCAPRMEALPTAWKGLVILNSKISSAEGNSTYLARTPWKDGYYNQVSYIGCEFEGIDGEVWYKEPIAVKKALRTVVGWKMDRKSAENLGLSVGGRDDVLDDDTAKKEFAGRNSILNRSVKVSKGQYKKAGKVWDTASLAKSNGWSVSDDPSSWD